jgi:aminopeptidase N
MMFKRFVVLFSGVLVIQACSVFKKTPPEPPVAVNLDTLVTTPKDPVLPVYNASATRMNDILHTRLEVSFDWNKEYLFGKATISVKPYFYPTALLELDARGMEIKQVALVQGNEKKELKFAYEDDVLKIQLDKIYTNKDEYTVFIDYTAKPAELKKGGSAAIRDDRGLYFINPQGKEKDKPQQIWTQGETQANSVWFPTFDRPNERMTEEIFITTEKRFVTLSNGELVSSYDNGNGTRTDHWKMDLPHAPYLVMMAIGDFAIVKDKWRGKEVNYYVEKEYEPHAKAIFGNTPEMMEFFSEKLGIPFQWNKYAQVVVRDYVSGAMENTSATLHGEFLQQTDREMLDHDYEDVISHELFHQWFGDLVTCESWSNLPLNESFATYGEYLWEEFKYGREAADEHSRQSREQYFDEAVKKKEPLIRFQYDNREDMFDRHSYNKGGQVLHMLRKYVGDDAFFASLKLYLETNKFKPAEIHNLRLAFEQVTGEDLNWFFNQWFLSPGHPELVISTSYDESARKVTINIKQTQDFTKTRLFEMPMDVDIYSNGGVERKKIRVTKADQEFVFDVTQKPDLVNVDAEKMLLCRKTDKKSIQEWAFQYTHAPLYIDRYEALTNLADKASDSLATKTILLALNDKSWNLRKKAIKTLKYCKAGRENEIKNKLLVLAKTDEKAGVREEAVSFLSENYKEADLKSFFESVLHDRSYGVASAGLEALAKKDSVEGIRAAKQFENEKSIDMLLSVMHVYASYGSDENNAFFINAAERFKGYYKIGFIVNYGNFLERVKNYETLNSGVRYIASIGGLETEAFINYYARRSLKDLENVLAERIKSTTKKLAVTPNDKALQDSLEKDKEEKEKITEVYKSISKS